MKLVISHMQEGENPFQFDSRTDGWVREVIQHVGEKGYQLNGDLRLNFRLTKLEPDYILRGKMDFSVQQICARCAESFSLPVRHSFDVAFAHVSNLKLRSHELAEESDELDVNFFEGNEIDLVPVIEEQFFLSLPYQSLCRTDCQGMCQKCGKNLNGAGSLCHCSSINETHPFSVLSGIKV